MGRSQTALLIILISVVSLFPQIKALATNSTEAGLITITYDYNDGIKIVTIHSGETVDLWIPDEIEGAELAYWITNPEAEIKDWNIVTSDTVFYEDTTIYAVWKTPSIEVVPEKEHPVLDAESAKNLYPPIEEPTTYDVTFDSCNGSSLWTWCVEKNTAIGTLPARPQKDRYFFLGWYTEENGGLEITEKTIITSDMTVYAHWEEIEEGYYTVLFNKNYGTEDMIVCEWISTHVNISPAVTRKNYIFTGWYTKKTGGKKIKIGMKLTSDMTLYAHWSKVTVKRASVKKLSSEKNKLMVMYNKVSSADGYQIQISTSKKFTKKATRSKVYAGNKAVTRTFSKLKSNKTYYVRVRAYKKDSTDSKVYGKWSKVKRVTITK